MIRLEPGNRREWDAGRYREHVELSLLELRGQCLPCAVAQRSLDLECLQETRNVVARGTATRPGADPLACHVGERLNGRLPHHDEVEWRVVHREHRTHGAELLAAGPVGSAVPALQRHAHGDEADLRVAFFDQPDVLAGPSVGRAATGRRRTRVNILASPSP